MSSLFYILSRLRNFVLHETVGLSPRLSILPQRVLICSSPDPLLALHDRSFHPDCDDPSIGSHPYCLSVFQRISDLDSHTLGCRTCGNSPSPSEQVCRCEVHTNTCELRRASFWSQRTLRKVALYLSSRLHLPTTSRCRFFSRISRTLALDRLASSTVIPYSNKASCKKDTTSEESPSFVAIVSDTFYTLIGVSCLNHKPCLPDYQYPS